MICNLSLFGFIPDKAEQPPQYMELKEKEENENFHKDMTSLLTLNLKLVV